MTQSLRIAVADDEFDMRDFFERMLKRCGHQVVSVADNGRELVEHCRELNPDLVITDIKMPEMDGIEASREICRERPIPVILVSAHQDAKLIERAEANSVLAYLVKPIGPDDLVPAIAIAMRRFEELQALRKETADLRQALSDRKVIEQAKGILMRVAAIDEKTAFRRLQELAADRNQKLIEAAQSVVALEKTLRPA
jgi:two-component system, response regulator PdtaR